MHEHNGMIQKTIHLNLRRHVSRLAGHIGERHMWRPGSLERSADYIESEFLASGYRPVRHNYTAYGRRVCNLVAVKPGRVDDTIVIGAHYDSVPGSPGADDNASAVAGLLELARLIQPGGNSSTIHFVAFANEESPCFGSDYMGSMRYARFLKESGTRVAFMVCLEMIGFFDKRLTQRYPLKFLRHWYPEKADFIGVVSNLESARIAWSLTAKMRAAADIRVACLVAPLPVGGVERSDHSAFWHYGFKALMITDTAQYRNKHYHKETDTPDTLDFNAMTQVVTALHAAIVSIA
jgi:Zn-dependent M28 family amino/carboxypeptidase